MPEPVNLFARRLALLPYAERRAMLERLDALAHRSQDAALARFVATVRAGLELVANDATPCDT